MEGRRWNITQLSVFFLTEMWSEGWSRGAAEGGWGGVAMHNCEFLSARENPINPVKNLG